MAAKTALLRMTSQAEKFAARAAAAKAGVRAAKSELKKARKALKAAKKDAKQARRKLDTARTPQSKTAKKSKVAARARLAAGAGAVRSSGLRKPRARKAAAKSPLSPAAVAKAVIHRLETDSGDKDDGAAAKVNGVDPVTAP